MTQPSGGIESITERLLRAPEPIAFLDVVMLVRRARQLGDPTDSALRALLALNQAPHTTDGARRVLDEYLTACARRHENQAALGMRVIRLKDSGKRARIPVGGTLTIELEERRTLGWRWEIDDQRGPIKIKSSRGRSVSNACATYCVTALREGRASVKLQEAAPPGGLASSENASECFFALNIEIEPISK